MNKKVNTTTSVNAALTYLIAKQATHKLNLSVPVLGTNLCIWLPKVASAIAFDLPRLTVNRL